jgi:hypothetical protein
MIKNIRDNYRIYGLIIVEIAKKLILLDYGLSNTTFKIPNHSPKTIYSHINDYKVVCSCICNLYL